MFDRDEVADKFPDAMLTSMLDGVYDFYGVDDTSFCIGVNGARMVLEALEDPDDGYRSYFGCFRTSEVGKVFFGRPIARVKWQEGGKSFRKMFMDDDDAGGCADLDAKDESFTGWVLKDVDTGHVWLTVGTDYGDDYYPCFTFRYTPDTNMETR